MAKHKDPVFRMVTEQVLNQGMFSEPFMRAMRGEKRRKYRFFFHFNRPATVAAGKPQITVHFQNKCHVVDNVVCNVATEGKMSKSQPMFVMRGVVSPENFKIEDGVAVIG